MTPIARVTVIAAALGMFASAAAASQYLDARPDGSWVTLKGIVTSSGEDGFMLDHGGDSLTVATNDWGGAAVRPGDEVNVYGYVEHDARDTARIDASAVYVDRHGRYFHAGESEAHERMGTAPDQTSGADERLSNTVVGTVTETKGRQFTLSAPDRTITVDTSDTYYDPMDRAGSLRIDLGDRVNVSGQVDRRGVMRADTIVTLAGDRYGESG